MRTSKVVVLAGIAGLVSALLACSAPASRDAAAELVAQADAVPTPKLDWAPCQEPGLSGRQCATVKVPIDYAKPQGETLNLAVLKQPAKDPARRIGTLFTAVGGPGGSGLDWARHGELFPDSEIARRFDVVTFDQRGIGRSGQIRCFPDAQAQEQFWRGRMMPPVNPEQEQSAEAASRQLAASCAANAGPLLGHLTSVHAARDLDLLRRAVGDAKLTYEGGSYASYLGEVYGALFGDRVRALQLSAMIDPISYTTDTVSHIHDSSVGTEQVLTEFLRNCVRVGSPKCAFAGGPAGGAPGSADPVAALRARNSAVLQRLEDGPIVVGRGERAEKFTYAEVIPLHASLLYDAEQGWPGLSDLMTNLERGQDGDPAVVREVLGAINFRSDFLDSFTAITCADTSLPRNPGNWPAMARQLATDAPTYGPHWIYLDQPCAAWPSPPAGYPQRYTGPWTLRSETPALLINNRFDPVTGLPFAERAVQQLGNARLVVNDAYGHEPPGTCVKQVRERYLVDLQLPAPGFGCAADHAPFAD
ncbi:MULTISPECIES: alpha/beta hydrolase [unclassified Nocardia]|uniref:alpha/beta hydrolase n=1 Tax=unclassified Nocardia TaxID=2637762 RepID=UPI001CE3E1C3|nr:MULTISPECIES: alpha/beta hydrolase [unclassified Nocardia]